MDKAKAAVSSFLHRDGDKSTTVHETVNPAVQKEHVTPTRHENVTTAIDREVHQDHHHTSIQPVKDKEVKPEKHTHNVAGVEHRDIHHGNTEKVNERVQAERANFTNTREVGATQHSQSAATVAGENIHHHVHETIQPVIQKETIQPHVVHTTVPVHEVHHNEPKHHAATALPAVSMHEYKSAGGSLTGRNERTDAFQGAPGAIGANGHHVIGGRGAQGQTHLTERDGGDMGTRNNNPGMGHDRETNAHQSSGGVNMHSSDRSDTHVGKNKSSLMDKINPKKDADGDGKAGIMD